MPVIDWKTWDDATEKRIERSRVLPSALLSGLDVEMLSNDRSVILWLREIPKPTSSAQFALPLLPGEDSAVMRQIALETKRESSAM
ncbi:uncharacterized protein RAG0_03657 [Rhynchosporium agropyri]|uniref:Uncharacterized protein n=1 Tax=Rhynchosporium agropyri TaxID=914238 RepID=A0A1E1K5B7_9HELO|nr:uncharacterized protein RAG0_03657 [Rhynchosporium agropyri]